jgi:hypothetical protein
MDDEVPIIEAEFTEFSELFSVLFFCFFSEDRRIFWGLQGGCCFCYTWAWEWTLVLYAGAHDHAAESGGTPAPLWGGGDAILGINCPLSIVNYP